MENGHQRLRRYRVSIAHHIYHVTACTRDRRGLFVEATAFAVAACFADHRILRKTRMLAWVLMPDHAHWLLQLGSGDTLAAVVTRLKCASARAANRSLGQTGPIWSRAFHDHGVRDEQRLVDIANYIRMNPVRAGLASSPRNYPFWDVWWL